MLDSLEKLRLLLNDFNSRRQVSATLALIFAAILWCQSCPGALLFFDLGIICLCRTMASAMRSMAELRAISEEKRYTRRLRVI